jgi:hypothetical protein
VVQPSWPAIYKLLLVVFLHNNNNLHLQNTPMTTPCMFLAFLCTLWEHKLQLSLLYPTPTKLFCWNLQTQIISISKCRWSPIFLIKVLFTSLTDQCRVLHPMFLTFLLVLPLQSAFLFFIESIRINLFWVHYSPLSSWMCCM